MLCLFLLSVYSHGSQHLNSSFCPSSPRMNFHGLLISRYIKLVSLSKDSMCEKLTSSLNWLIINIYVFAVVYEQQIHPGPHPHWHEGESGCPAGSALTLWPFPFGGFGFFAPCNSNLSNVPTKLLTVTPRTLLKCHICFSEQQGWDVS